MSELLPCPWCGQQPEISKSDNNDRTVRLQCPGWNGSCSMAPHTGFYPPQNGKTSLEISTVAWNTRTPDPSTVKVLEEALPILDRLVNSDWAINNYPTLRIKGALELAAQQYDNLNALLTRLKG